MDVVGHGGSGGGVLAVPPQGGRQEWRARADGSGSRYTEETPRVPGPGHPRGSHRQNNHIFHSGSSGNSSDSDHHTGDLVGAPQHGGGQIDDSMMSKEKGHQQDEHFDSAINSLSLSSGILGLSDSPEDGLQRQLHEIIRQREQLQNMELDIRAQFIARSEVLRIQSEFEEQNKQNAAIIANLQEQVQEMEMRTHNLEQQLDEKEHQLHANQLEANEAVSQVWAKDGLLREQNNELVSLRRERDNAVAEHKAAAAQFEAERAQLLAQVEDLKDQNQEKELRVQEIDEQHRNIQEMLKYKDGQLRDAHAWIHRAHELDAFHANNANSLHAELRDRTDQINQLWLNYQRQLAEVERYHSQALQRLQAEITEIKEQNRVLRSTAGVESEDDGALNMENKDGDRYDTSDTNSILSATQNNHSKGNSGVTEGARATMFQQETSTKAEHAITGVPVARTPLLGVAPGLLSAPLAVTYPFGAQPGLASALQPGPLQIAQFQPIPTIIPTQHEQVQHQLPQAQRCIQRQPQNPQSNVKAQAKKRNEQYQHSPPHDLDQLSLHERTVKGEQSSHSSEMAESSDLLPLLQLATPQRIDSKPEGHLSNGLPMSSDTSIMNNHESLARLQYGNETDKLISQSPDLHISVLPVNQQLVGGESNSKVDEPILMDEKSLLACLVRAIPSEPSAKIRISTTLPNRLGKMLAPLHWHDYKRQYGRLHDFVLSHPELFVIDGDSVHLREGAHAIVSATTAVAKVAAAAAAAAAAASLAESSWFPAIAVTPVAHSQTPRLKGASAQLEAKQGASLQKTSSSSSSSTMQGQFPLGKSIMEDGKVANHHHSVTILANASVKHDEQRVMRSSGARRQPHGISPTANGVDLKKAAANKYGNSCVLNGSNDSYFVNQQPGRNSTLVSGDFRKQELNNFPQTKENCL